MISSEKTKIAIPLTIFTVALLSLFQYNEAFNSYMWVVVSGIGFGTYALFRGLFVKENTSESFLELSILSLPFSFVSIFGVAHRYSFLSWFNIFMILFLISRVLPTIKMLTNGTAKYFKDNAWLLATILVTIVVFLTKSLTGPGIKGTAQVIFFFVAVLVARSMNVSTVRIRHYIKLFTYGVIITAIQVIVQRILFAVFGMEVGFFRIFEVNYVLARISIGGLFADYSYASIYLLVPILMLGSLDLNKFKKAALVVFLILASILTSSRTGIISLIFLACALLILKVFKGGLTKENKKMILYFICFLLFAVVVYSLLSARSILNIFSNNGRFKLIYESLGIISENPITGVGFDISNYGPMMVHNYIFQYIAQGGIFFFLFLVVSTVIEPLLKSRESSLKMGLLFTLFASMFVTNLLTVPFFIIQSMLISLEVSEVGIIN